MELLKTVLGSDPVRFVVAELFVKAVALKLDMLTRYSEMINLVLSSPEKFAEVLATLVEGTEGRPKRLRGGTRDRAEKGFF
jgi:hypothetical protein